MPFPYISVEEAIAADGLRMVVVGNVPSPWGEAAKGILHIKGLDWSAVRLVYDDPALMKWAGELSGPVAIYNDEAPKSGWAEILLLAERLAPEPALIPSDPEARALLFGLCHEVLGPEGLCWSRRLQSIHGGLAGRAGFNRPVAEYLAGKYGYTPELAEIAGGRVVDLLGMFAERLHTQSSRGCHYLMGDTVSAVDVYLAAAMALFAPLPDEVCAISAQRRATFEAMDAATRAALDPILLVHRDHMYAAHLELPLSL